MEKYLYLISGSLILMTTAVVIGVIVYVVNSIYDR